MTEMTNATGIRPIDVRCDIISAEKNAVQQAIEEQGTNGTQDLGGGALDVRPQLKHGLSLMACSDTSTPPLL